MREIQQINQRGNLIREFSKWIDKRISGWIQQAIQWANPAREFSVQIQRANPAGESARESTRESVGNSSKQSSKLIARELSMQIQQANSPGEFSKWIDERISGWIQQVIEQANPARELIMQIQHANSAGEWAAETSKRIAQSSESRVQIGQRINKRNSERNGKWINMRNSQRISRRISKRISERINERNSERIGQRIGKRILLQLLLATPVWRVDESDTMVSNTIATVLAAMIWQWQQQQHGE